MSARGYRGAWLAWSLLASLGCGRTSREVGDVADAAPPPSAVSVDVAARSSGFVAVGGGAFAAGPDRARFSAFSSSIDVHGATLAEAAATPPTTLRATRFGRAGAMRALPPAARVVERAGRVELARADLTEWYVRDGRGLEQGFDLATRPEGSGALVIDLAVGGRTPSLAHDRKSVTLRGGRGARPLVYGALLVTDARHTVVPAWLTVDGANVSLHVDDAEAAYPIVVDPLVIGQQEAELLASDGASNDYSGGAVAISGVNVVVGAFGKNLGGTYRGAAYVFAQSGASWSQQVLSTSDGTSGDAFGSSVAIRGTTALVGAPGKSLPGLYAAGVAYVFTQSGTTWSQQQELVASDASTQDAFGTSVALSPDGATAMVSSLYAKNGTTQFQGAVYVFTRSGTTWTETQKLVASDSAGYLSFGTALSIDAGHALIGASGKQVGGGIAGGAYVFARSGSSWSEEAALVASDAANGDAFGISVALQGTTALIGARTKTIGGHAGQGAVYVYGASGSTWSQQQQLVASDGVASDAFGAGVALDGPNAIVGASGATVSIGHQGAAYVFTQTGATWGQAERFFAADGTTNAGFGSAVALEGTTTVVGASKQTVTVNANQGAAYVFVPAHTTGDACATGSDCLTGNCVDGVCCASASCPACGTCGGATPGTCAPKSAGATSTTSCGVYLCDGSAMTCPIACTSDASCAGGTKCDASKHCSKLSLGTTCATGDDCASGFCTDGVCCGRASCDAPQKCDVAGVEGSCSDPGGAACVSDGDCGSGHCVDGVCCDGACSGQCEACDVAGHVGTCTPVLGGPHGSREGCDALPTSDCGKTQCDGASTDHCGGFANGATRSCGVAGCSGDKAIAATSCDGKGACVPAVATSCVPFACAAGACKSTCATSDDCASGFRCDAVTGTCAQGKTCSADGTTSIDQNGISTPCAPYVCGSDGACKMGCATTDDCAAGDACSGGVCAATASGGGSGSGGCAWETTPTRGAGYAFVVAALVVGAFGRRRGAGRRTLR